MLPARQREMARHFAGKPVMLLCVVHEQNWSVLRRMREQGQLSAAVIVDRQERIRKRWNIPQKPAKGSTIYLIDAEGIIRERDLPLERLKPAVRYWLSEASTASASNAPDR